MMFPVGAIRPKISANSAPKTNIMNGLPNKWNVTLLLINRSFVLFVVLIYL